MRIVVGALVVLVMCSGLRCVCTLCPSFQTPNGVIAGSVFGSEDQHRQGRTGIPQTLQGGGRGVYPHTKPSRGGACVLAWLSSQDFVRGCVPGLDPRRMATLEYVLPGRFRGQVQCASALMVKNS